MKITMMNRGWLAASLMICAMFAPICPSSGAESRTEKLAPREFLAALVIVYYAPSPSAAPENTAAELLKTKYRYFARRDRLAPKDVEPSVHVNYVDVKEAQLEPPSAELLKYFGRGVSAEQVALLQKSTHALALSFVYRQADVLHAIDEMSKFSAAVATASNGLLWDEETRELFTVDAWTKTRIEQWSDGYPMVTKHTTLHAYNNGDLVRAVTLGMAKFGLPDLVIEDFGWADADPIGSSINALQQLMIEGAPVPNSGPFDIDINGVKHAVFRKHLLDLRIENAQGTGRIALRAAKAGEGDPDNRLLEISFDRYDGKSPQERQVQFVAQMFGHRDSVVMAEHTGEVEAASRRAKQRFATLRGRFDRGLEPGERLLVKAPFKTSSQGNEWMWVEVIKWQGKAITGLLRNDPEFVPNLRAGATVQVKQDEIFDYLHYLPDGTMEGNETQPLLERNAR